MNRVSLVRSRLRHPGDCLQIILLTVGIACIACPVWSLPSVAVSHAAIDLLEEGGEIVATQERISRSQKSGFDVRSSAEAHSKSAQPNGVRSQKVKVVDSTGEARASDFSRSQEVKEQNEESLLPTTKNQKLTTTSTQTALNPEPPPLPNLDPELIQRSPVLRRWLKRVPNVLADIKNDPSFRTRLRLGYAQFPSTKQASGLNVGIEDVFLGRSGLTLSADYQTAFNGKREAWGTDLRYYVRPLGSYINVAPIVGYRHLETTRYTIDGVNVGLRLLLVPSRTGAADIALTQSWVSPGSDEEVGLTTLSVGYALTHNLRLSTDLQKQNSRFRSDSRVGISLEWMF